jgi:hypothetical protein
MAASRIRSKRVTPATRRAAAASALSQMPKTVRITPGQRKAILSGQAVKRIK